MNLTLTRFAYLDNGVFGRLVLPSGIRLYTVERPWLDNATSVSCIPEGRYRIKPRHYFGGGYDAYEICNVPGRTHILFHVANWPHDVEGCVGLGRRLDLGEPAVWESTPAFKRFMSEMKGKTRWLTITHAEALL